MNDNTIVIKEGIDLFQPVTFPRDSIQEKGRKLSSETVVKIDGVSSNENKIYVDIYLYHPDFERALLFETMPFDLPQEDVPVLFESDQILEKFDLDIIGLYIIVCKLLRTLRLVFEYKNDCLHISSDPRQEEKPWDALDLGEKGYDCYFE